jgi:hypothetical protein
LPNESVETPFWKREAALFAGDLGTSRRFIAQGFAARAKNQLVTSEEASSEELFAISTA